MKHDQSITDPALQRTMAAEGAGFYCPVLPDPQAVLAYMRLYCMQRTRWGEPPELGVLRSSFQGQVTAYPFPIAKATWDAYNQPRKLLQKLARVLLGEGRTDHALLRAIDRSMLADMVGVYLRSEGWAPPKGTEAEAPRYREQGRSGYSFAQLDGRREGRSVLAVQLDCTRLCVAHYRDTPEEFTNDAFNPRAPVTRRTRPIGGDLPPVLLEIAYGLVRHMRPPYANDPPPDPQENPA